MFNVFSTPDVHVALQFTSKNCKGVIQRQIILKAMKGMIDNSEFTPRLLLLIISQIIQDSKVSSIIPILTLLLKSNHLQVQCKYLQIFPRHIVDTCSSPALCHALLWVLVIQQYSKRDQLSAPKVFMVQWMKHRTRKHTT